MEKSLWLTSKLNKCRTSRNILLTDLISGLPDDILATILSHLTMKEAARTSILSHRWKDLWTNTTGSLDFDGSKTFWTIKLSSRMYLRKPEPVEERPAFIKWRARRLELDLERVVIRWESIYPLPTKSVIGHPTIISLTNLKLNYVDITRELLEYLLSNCPFLEFVSVGCSPSLVGAKVVAASSKLHYLEISNCHCVEFLEIYSAINLRTLKYAGPEARLRFENAPNLADVSFGGVYCGEIIHKFHGHSIPLSQIEKLKLDLGYYVWFSDMYDTFPILENLKQLELVLAGWDSFGLLCYATLLEKCPMLYKLCVEFKWFEGTEEIEIEEKECRLECLTFVEMFAFRGSIIDMKLAMFLVTNAPYLEKFIIDTRIPHNYSGTPLEVLQDENVGAKKDVKQLLSTKLSPGVEFFIL